MTQQTSHSSPADLHDEHRHLSQLLGQLRAKLADQRIPLVKIITYFDDLRVQIESHFAHEEEGGFFHEELLEAPHLWERAQTLLAQHRQFEDSLDDMCTLVKNGDGTRQWWIEIAAQFEEFMKHFCEHEQGERALLIEAYDRDMGAED